MSQSHWGLIRPEDSNVNNVICTQQLRLREYASDLFDGDEHYVFYQEKSTNDRVIDKENMHKAQEIIQSMQMDLTALRNEYAAPKEELAEKQYALMRLEAGVLYAAIYGIEFRAN